MVVDKIINKMETIKIKKETKKAVYEKPKFVERNSLAFPKEIWEQFNGGRFCIQCSGCHGCR
jgi:hypothetical protein